MAEPVIALVHGWGGSFSATYASCGWPALAAARGRSLAGITLPGHGPEPAAQAPHAYADLAGLLAAALPAGPIDAVGFSLGGKLLLELAIRTPHLFRRLVIGGVGNNVFAPEGAGDALATALEQGVRAATAPAIAALVDYAGQSRSNPFALAAILRRPPNPVITPARLRAVQTKLLLINGAADNIATPDDALRAALPHARAISLPGVTHLALPAAPQFQRLALEFLGPA